MINAEQLKGCAAVVLLLAALTAFDAFNNYPGNQITGAAVSTAVATEVRIETGWNNIGINTLQNLASTTCGSDKIDGVVWAWYPQVNDYGKYKLSNDMKIIESAGDEKSDSYRNAYPDTLSATRAVWLYNFGDACTITSNLAPLTTDTIMPAGWNMLAVQPNWQGKKLSELMGNCELPEELATAGIAGFFYSYPTGWEVINPDTTFSQAELGLGMWLYTSNDCTLQKESELAAGLRIVQLEYEPENPKAGESLNVRIRVRNEGATEVKTVAVKMKVECNKVPNTQPFAFEQGIELQPGGEGTLNTGFPLYVRPGECELSVEVGVTGDANAQRSTMVKGFMVKRSHLASVQNRVAVVMVNYPDTPSGVPKEPLTLQEVKEKIVDVLSEDLQRNSYGEVSMNGDVYGWHTTAMKGFTPDCQYRPYITVLGERVKNLNIDAYNLIIFIFNGCSRGGRADYMLPGFVLDGKVLPGIIAANAYPQDYVNGKLELDTILPDVLEEYGHMLGALHAGWAVCSEWKCQLALSNELSSVMGNGGYTYNAINKEGFGWIEGKITTIDVDGSYAIAAIDATNIGDNKVALKIFRETNLKNKGHLYVEYRERIEKEILKEPFKFKDPDFKEAYPKFLNAYKDGLFIYLDQPMQGIYDSYLVDTHTDTILEDELKPFLEFNDEYKLVDAPLRLGETFTDPETGIAVKYVSLNAGIATVKVTNLPK